MIGPAGFMAGPKPNKPRECDCVAEKCQPEQNEGCRCWRSNWVIPVGYFSESEGAKP